MTRMVLAMKPSRFVHCRAILQRSVAHLRSPRSSGGADGAPGRIHQPLRQYEVSRQPSEHLTNDRHRRRAERRFHWQRVAHQKPCRHFCCHDDWPLFRMRSARNAHCDWRFHHQDTQSMITGACFGGGATVYCLCLYAFACTNHDVDTMHALG